MSVPYGMPPQQAGTPVQTSAGPNIGFILALAAAGLGLVIYLCSFADDAAAALNPWPFTFQLVAALLAGLSVLPKTPKATLPATALSVTSVLILVTEFVKSPTGTVKAIAVVILIAAILQAGALVVALLMDAEIVKFTPKAAVPYGQPGGWNPQSGAFPQQFGQPQQGQQPPGQPPFGQQPPAAAQQPPAAQGQQQTQFIPQTGQFGGQQPGQHGQHGQPGTPPSGFGQS